MTTTGSDRWRPVDLNGVRPRRISRSPSSECAASDQIDGAGENSRRNGRLLKSIARAQLLILDDWGLSHLTPDQGRDLLEILDDRQGRGSTIVTSQVDVKH